MGLRLAGVQLNGPAKVGDCLLTSAAELESDPKVVVRYSTIRLQPERLPKLLNGDGDFSLAEQNYPQLVAEAGGNGSIFASCRLLPS